MIGTYFCDDFCLEKPAPPPPTAEDDDDSGDDDKDRRVSSLASFRSFSASTSTLMLFFDDDEEASFSSSSSNNAFPFTTVFPDFKDVFKSSRGIIVDVNARVLERRGFYRRGQIDDLLFSIFVVKGLCRRRFVVLDGDV